jgi:hypothetical protein
MGTNNKNALRWQTGFVIAIFILFIPVIYLSKHIYHTARYGVVVVCAITLFIGISSIISQISILKPTWQKELPRGKQAVIIGSLLTISEIIAIIILLSPILPDGF